jgi:fluoride ion exporter CrcB/FEX
MIILTLAVDWNRPMWALFMICATVVGCFALYYLGRK